jgi:hypothetical protein
VIWEDQNVSRYRMVTTIAYGADGFTMETNRVPEWRVRIVHLMETLDTLSNHWLCTGIVDHDDIPDHHWRFQVWHAWQHLATLDCRPRFYVDRGYISDEKAATIDPEFVEMLRDE